MIRKQNSNPTQYRSPASVVGSFANLSILVVEPRLIASLSETELCSLLNSKGLVTSLLPSNGKRSTVCSLLEPMLSGYIPSKTSEHAS
jgi:hypothetical protein